MTDDKGAGEGPYTVSDLDETGEWILRGSTFLNGYCIFGYGNDAYDAAIEYRNDANKIFAAGRKAERERCAKIAENEAGEIPECMTGRIIAEKIRGGQDGE